MLNKKLQNCSLGILLLVTSLLSSKAFSEYVKLDGIVAVVDEDVVLASELLERINLVRESMIQNKVPMPERDVFVGQVLDRLIIENIQLQEANNRGVVIDDQTLSQAVQQFAESNGQTVEEFVVGLESQGTSYRKFREDIRLEMTLSRLQRGMINQRISISDQDISGLLNSPFYKDFFSDEYSLGHIRLDLTDNPSERDKELLIAEADNIVEQLRGGEDFGKLAAAKSSSSTALDGGSLGWRRAGEIPSLFAEIALEMEIGDISDPIVSGSAVHIIKLIERRGAGMQELSQTLVSHILIKPSAIRTNKESRDLSESIYRQLLQGSEFAALAKEYSDDPGTALNGGSLGWSEEGQFVPEFSEVMGKTETGQLSEPFLSPFGWHVLRVDDRRVQNISDEARREMAIDILFKRRFEEERQEWLKEIRDEAYVEIRI
jgi:peptidyl-prolyl cis-trans isomerase SurA